MAKLLRGMVVVAILALGAAAPVVAQSWQDDGYRPHHRAYPHRGEVAYNDGYIRSGRDWARPDQGVYHDGDTQSRSEHGHRAYGCTVRHVYFNRDLDRYTVVHRPVPCRDDDGAY